jgi:hypothetical protein
VNKEITLKLLTHDCPTYYSQSAVRVQKEVRGLYTTRQSGHTSIHPAAADDSSLYLKQLDFLRLATSGVELWTNQREHVTAC